jgi:hypothetical protein
MTLFSEAGGFAHRARRRDNKQESIEVSPACKLRFSSHTES